MQLEVGKTYEVTVVKILPIGAVVEMEDGSTELVHISNIADCFVPDVADFVSVGKSYTATCREGKKRPIELTFIPLGLKSERHMTGPIFNYNRKHNIDDMIDSANSSYADKQRIYDKRKKRR